MGYKILVADDDLEILDLLKLSLESEGHTVVTAANGEEAYNKATSERFDGIVLDIMMPKMNGFEVCEKLRENFSTALVPIIMLTSLTKTKDKVTGLKIGADEYLTKPIEPVEFVARVEQIIERSKKLISANPLTALPGRNSLEEDINNFLSESVEFYLIFLDVNNFRYFNEKYGYMKGDNFIRLLASLLQAIAQEVGRNNPIVRVYHLGSDDFCITSPPNLVDTISQLVIENFFKFTSRLYDKETLEKGYFSVRDVDGQYLEVPLLTVAVGAAFANKNMKHFIEIFGRAQRAWRHAKEYGQNHYYKLD
jgi:diguanylate cyclase (GGDEF)-like protein